MTFGDAAVVIVGGCCGLPVVFYLAVVGIAALIAVVKGGTDGKA